MTHIPITPAHSGFGSYKMPCTDAEWSLFHLFVRYHKENGHYLGMKR